MADTHLELRGVTIKEDVNGCICLTDLWHLVGDPSSKATTFWRRLPTTGELIEALRDNLRKSQGIGKIEEKSVIYSKGGKGGGTYAHPILALAYAEYLNADLAVDVKNTYLRVRQGDITLVDEVLAKAEAARHHNEVRDMSKEVRKKYGDTLTAHGAGGPAIGYCTDAIYEVLLGGTAKQIIASRNLPAKTNVRNTLPTGELLQTLNTEYLSAERIEGLNIHGKEPCAEASRQVARFVKDVFQKVREDQSLGDENNDPT